MLQKVHESYRIGQKLKEERERKKTSISAVSKNLKIEEKYIRAIENGDYSTIVATVYLQGMVKSYAKFLELDPNSSLKMLKREMEIKKKNVVEQDLSIKKENTVRMTPGRFFWSLFFASLTIFVIIMTLKTFIATRRPKLIITDPIFAEAQMQEDYIFDTTSPILIIKGKITSGNSVSINGSIIETFGMDFFETRALGLQEGSNEFIIKTKNQFGIENSINLLVFFTAKEESNIVPITNAL